jgi:hypothetical protein
MKRLICALIFCLVASMGNAITVTSGTVTIVADNTSPNARDYLNCYTVDWLSDSGGNVTASIDELRGTIERIVFNPDDGATSPTNNYDMTLNDQDGIDTLNGKGANLSQSTASSTISTEGDGTTNIPMAVSGTLSLAITNAGNAKGGIIRVYIRR